MTAVPMGRQSVPLWRGSGSLRQRYPRCVPASPSFSRWLDAPPYTRPSPEQAPRPAAARSVGPKRPLPSRVSLQQSSRLHCSVGPGCRRGHRLTGLGSLTLCSKGTRRTRPPPRGSLACTAPTMPSPPCPLHPSLCPQRRQEEPSGASPENRGAVSTQSTGGGMRSLLKAQARGLARMVLMGRKKSKSQRQVPRGLASGGPLPPHPNTLRWALPSS